jgi:hypothetical protein
MQTLRLCQELFFGLGMRRIIDARVDGAHSYALFFVMKTDTLGALGRDDVVVLRGKGWEILAVQFVLLTAGVNCFVGALGFASAAIDALFVDKQWHVVGSSAKKIYQFFFG